MILSDSELPSRLLLLASGYFSLSEHCNCCTVSSVIYCFCVLVIKKQLAVVESFISISVPVLGSRGRGFMQKRLHAAKGITGSKVSCAQVG